DDSRLCRISPDTRIAVRDSIKRFCLLLESAQMDGIWGSYLDTIALIGTYIRIGSISSMSANGDEVDLTVQPRVAFRALRFMCDPTQTFSDGSMLHTSFLTTFYVITLMIVISEWPEAKKPVVNLYDELSLIMDRGTTVPRANYLSATLERDKANEL